jgi:hypothetical protein
MQPMLNLLPLVVLGVAFPGGFAAAGEDAGQLTLPEAIGRLRQGIPIYACAGRPDWFSDQPGECPGGRSTLQMVEDIQNGKALFGRDKNMAQPHARNTEEKP